MSYLTIDIETTGLPKQVAGGYKHLIKYDTCRILSITWIKCNMKHEAQKIVTHYIKHDPQIEIPPDTTEYNGITQEIIDQKGIQLKDALAQLSKAIRQSNFLVGFNILFDVTVLRSESYRLGDQSMIDQLNRTPKLCVQVLSHVNWKDLGFDLKESSTLSNIYYMLFDYKYEAYQSENDAIATIEVLAEIDQRKLVDWRIDVVKDEMILKKEKFMHTDPRKKGLRQTRIDNIKKSEQEKLNG